MRVLVKPEHTKSGFTVVQNSIDGNLYLLTPCCNELFNEKNRCMNCNTSYAAWARTYDVDLNLVVHIRTTDISEIQRWTDGVTGMKTEVHIL